MAYFKRVLEQCFDVEYRAYGKANAWNWCSRSQNHRCESRRNIQCAQYTMVNATFDTLTIVAMKLTLVAMKSTAAVTHVTKAARRVHRMKINIVVALCRISCSGRWGETATGSTGLPQQRSVKGRGGVESGR
eukprot:m.212643 g.212643  ORF g.212643 m.212643 type:complete len:132 (+) comp19049_c0_seq2:105-500(+)